MAHTLEAIKGGGGSIKVGTTGTISALMSRELESKTASEPNDAVTGTKLKAGVQADEASTSCSSNKINEEHNGISQKKIKHHHARNGSRKPILRSDSVSIDGTSSSDGRKKGKKGSCMVEVVDVKCGVPDKMWANPITNRLKKLSFSKLSETNGVK